MKRFFALLAFATFAIATLSAQTTITATVSPHLCGRVSTPTYCYGLPFIANTGTDLANGSLWLDQQSSGTGFIEFLNSGLGQATITSAFQPLRTAGGTLNYSFAGNGYTGTLSLTYTEYYSSGGGGRGGAGAGYRWVVTGGTLTLNLQRTASSASPMTASPQSTYDACNDFYTYMIMEWNGYAGPDLYFGRAVWNCFHEFVTFIPFFPVG